MERFVIRMFGDWVTFWQTELAKGAAQWKRAEAFWEFSTLRRGFTLLKENAASTRARKHWRGRLLKRAFEFWLTSAASAALSKSRTAQASGAASSSSSSISAPSGLRASARVEKLMKAVDDSGISVSIEDLASRMEAEIEERAALNAAAQHAEAYAMFQEEAQKEAEKVHWEQVRLDAAKRVVQRRILDAQETLRRNSREVAWEKVLHSFESKWQEMVSAVEMMECVNKGRGHHKKFLHESFVYLVVSSPSHSLLLPSSSFPRLRRAFFLSRYLHRS
jgi:hypothetical protein